jgi:hypothetical protein
MFDQEPGYDEKAPARARCSQGSPRGAATASSTESRSGLSWSRVRTVSSSTSCHASSRPAEIPDWSRSSTGHPGPRRPRVAPSDCAWHHRDRPHMARRGRSALDERTLPASPGAVLGMPVERLRPHAQLPDEPSVLNRSRSRGRRSASAVASWPTAAVAHRAASCEIRRRRRPLRADPGALHPARLRV